MTYHTGRWQSNFFDILTADTSENCLGYVPGQLVRKWAGIQLFPSFLLFIFSRFFYFDRPPHRDLSLLSSSLFSQMVGKKKLKEKEKRRRREEEEKQKRRRRKREEPHALSLYNRYPPAPSSLGWEEEKEKENRRRRFWVDWFWCFICWWVWVFEDFLGWFGLIFLQVDFFGWFSFISAGWFWVGWLDFDFSAGWFWRIERKSEKMREWRNEGRERERDRWWWFFFLKLF